MATVRKSLKIPKGGPKTPKLPKDPQARGRVPPSLFDVGQRGSHAPKVGHRGVRRSTPGGAVKNRTRHKGMSPTPSFKKKK